MFDVPTAPDYERRFHMRHDQPEFLPVTPKEHRAYQERVKAQTQAWAEGRPYHNKIDNECCPDFSCCEPALFENDEAKRWEHYRHFQEEPLQ